MSNIAENEKPQIDLSVVIPVYNEKDSLPHLFKELIGVLAAQQRTFEIIFVDDCSSDGSSELLSQLMSDHPEHVRVLHMVERSGQTAVMRRGLELIYGSIAVTLDADLQNDPADIPRLVDKLERESLDAVCGWRKARQDKPLKVFFSKLGNVLQRTFTGMRIHDVSCTLRAYRKECVPQIGLKWEGQHRFIPMSLSLQGYKLGEIVSHHRQREFGESKYGHKRIFKVVFDFFKILITKGKG